MSEQEQQQSERIVNMLDKMTKAQQGAMSSYANGLKDGFELGKEATDGKEGG